MRVAYLDSSVALRAALPTPQRHAWRKWLTETRAHTVLIGSRLLQTEMVRTLRRDGLPLADASKVLSRIRLVPVTPDTFVVAEAIEQTIRTLDALHLATAAQTGLSLTVLTHDNAMRTVAESMGLAAFDPVGEGEAPRPIVSTIRPKEEAD
ncbi:type II toxin-antitoxin system VapC family toxin [Xylanimonas sp. McL0601]|uniref:type II toxin-antitoxin system VapC family toxin n=1 Tax=Xylanimonas sp. McL0601 TaxID=3414739 RepID=UPI003CE869B5